MAGSICMTASQRAEIAQREEHLSALKVLAEVSWHSMPVDAVLARLETSEAGLTSEQVASRVKKYGRNAMPDVAKPGILARIWDQVNNILIYVLIASTIIKAAFQGWLDFGLILGVIILNVAIGVIQEGKAEEAAEALNNMLAAQAVVIRDGTQQQIPAEDVVIGDIVNISAGDSIAADVRLFRVGNLKVRESALTGESEDVSKSLALCNEQAGIGDQKNRAFAGTFATSGQGMGVVVAVGPTAQIGAIKRMLDEAEAGDTPLQVQLDVFGKWLSIMTMVVAVASFFLAYYGRTDKLPASGNALSEAFAIAVSIAVAIIPEGLPSVVTITLALGVRSMAAHNAIIRQLPAVETLGSVSVVCSDKTGTLTVNQMMVTQVRTAARAYNVSGQGYDPTSGSVLEADGPKAEQLRWLALPAVLANEGGLKRHGVTVGGVSRSVSVEEDLPAASATVAGAATVAVGAEHVAVQLGTAKPATQANGGDAAAASTQASNSGSTVTWKPSGDPTDVALLVLAHKLGVHGRIEAFKNQYPVLDTVPFDSSYKFMAVMTDVDAPGGRGRKRVLYLKGAWDEIIRRCSLQAAGEDAFTAEPCDREFWLREASSYAARGMRVLAVAQMELPADTAGLTVEQIRDAALAEPCLQLNCLVAIVDPCRESAARAVALCHRAGVQVSMITGDHSDTACYIARELGIIDADTFARYLAVKDTDPEARRRIVLRGEDIKAIPSDPSESQLAQYVLDVHVYARVAPEHKLRIVRALKETHGRITAMTGDGVNDAPALKEAHVGVAMGITGTDVAKQAAKMILADDQFSTIAEAVRRGRGVYDNLKKVVLFALPTNMAQGVCVVAALIIGWDTPLNAIQVLTVNMVTSVTLGIVIALEEPEESVMTRPPRDPRESLLDRLIAWRTTYVTILLCIGVLGNMQWQLTMDGNRTRGRSVAMTTLVVAQCFYALNCRFQDSSLKLDVLRGNPWLFVAAACNIIIQILLVYVPGLNDAWGMTSMDGRQWGMVLLLAVGAFLGVELIKVVEPYLAPVGIPIADAFDACVAALSAGVRSLMCCWRAPEKEVVVAHTFAPVAPAETPKNVALQRALLAPTPAHAEKGAAASGVAVA